MVVHPIFFKDRRLQTCSWNNTFFILHRLDFLFQIMFLSVLFTYSAFVLTSVSTEYYTKMAALEYYVYIWSFGDGYEEMRGCIVSVYQFYYQLLTGETNGGVVSIPACQLFCHIHVFQICRFIMMPTDKMQISFIIG